MASSFELILKITSVVAALITTSLCVSYIINLRRYPQNIKSQSQKLFISISITCYAIAMIVSAINNLNTADHSSFRFLLGFLVQGFFWGTAISAAYILFITREFTTFRHSAYHSSRWLYCSLITGIITFFVCNVIIVVALPLSFKGIISADTEGTIHSAELVIKSVALLYVSVVLTYLFVSKLMALSLSNFDTELTPKSSLKEPLVQTPSGRSEQMTCRMTMSTAVQQPLVVNLKLSEMEINFLGIATKLTVLSSVMTVSSVTLLGVALASTFLSQTLIGGILWSFGTMFGLMVDSTVNALCIYLSLPYAQSRWLYGICCSRTLHKCCLKAATKRFQREKVTKLIKSEEVEI